jgi:hypothetical protein
MCQNKNLWKTLETFFTSLIIFENSVLLFVGLAYQGKEIVFRFIIEYSSLRDFGP